jgi:glutaredoxin-related protein
MRSLRKKVFPSESLFPPKNKLTNGEMKAIIYSNRNQECERAQSVLEACHLDETIVYYLDKDFTIRQFVDEFGDGAEFPQISIGYKHIGSLKDTLHHMSQRGMFV